jgi:hypothetical protein
MHALSVNKEGNYVKEVFKSKGDNNEPIERCGDPDTFFIPKYSTHKALELELWMANKHSNILDVKSDGLYFMTK